MAQVLVGFFSMGHVILFVYILIFSTGFTALVGLGVISTRNSQPIIKRLLIVQSLFIANLGLVAAYYYTAQVLNLISTTNYLEHIFGILAGLLSISLYGAILFLITTELLKKGNEGIYRVVFISCLVFMVMQILHLIGALLGKENLILLIAGSIIWQVCSYLCVAIIMAFLGMLMLHAKKNFREKPIQTLLTGVGISCIAFVPLGIIEYMLETFFTLSFAPISFEYVLYLGINISILIVLVQFLRQEPSKSGVFEKLSDEVAARYSLTARERQMAELIAQGLTNKEIGFQLRISEATVRTHIYNVFQKTGVQSRIELLKILHS